MSAALRDELLRAIRALPPRERLRLVEEVIHELTTEGDAPSEAKGSDDAGVDESVERAWAIEIERRARAALAGEAAGSDCDEFLERLETRLRPSL